MRCRAGGRRRGRERGWGSRRRQKKTLTSAARRFGDRSWIAVRKSSPWRWRPVADDAPPTPFDARATRPRASRGGTPSAFAAGIARAGAPFASSARHARQPLVREEDQGRARRDGGARALPARRELDGCAAAATELRGPDPEQWKLSADAARVRRHRHQRRASPARPLGATRRSTDVVVLSVVLDECRARSKASYERLRAMCQDPAKRFFVFANEHHRQTHVKAEPGEGNDPKRPRHQGRDEVLPEGGCRTSASGSRTTAGTSPRRGRRHRFALSCREFAADKRPKPPTWRTSSRPASGR